MNTPCLAAACSRPTETNLCVEHRDLLVAALRALAGGNVNRRDREESHHDREARPGLYDELLVTLTRQSNTGTASIGWVSGETETSVPFHTAASDTRVVADNVIGTWARAVADLYSHLSLTATTTTEAARWLATFPGLLAEHPAAGEMYADITGIVARIQRVIDRPLDKVYVGQCGADLLDDDGGEPRLCERDLYANPNRAWVDCPECGGSWDVADRKTYLLAAVEDQLATPSEISRALSRFYEPVSTSMIRGYAHRGRLTPHPPHPHDPKRAPRYRVGDVLDLLADVRAKAS
ncbi:hypothetical protein [Amycolatopsis japonica]